MCKANTAGVYINDNNILYERIDEGNVKRTHIKMNAYCTR